MTELEDAGIIRALHSAGNHGPAFAMTPLAETTRRGRAARRRHAFLVGTGTTALAAGLVTAAIAVPPTLDGPDGGPLTPAADPADEQGYEEQADESADARFPMTADEMIAAHKTAVFEALPDGFVRLTEENQELADGMAGFALAQESPASDGLANGMSGGISLMTFPAGDPVDLTGQWCAGLTEKGGVKTACADLRVDGQIVKVQQTTRPEGGKGGAYEATRTSYRQPSGDVVVLDLYAWEDDRQTTPERLAAARAWVESMHEQIVSVVLHPSFRPTEWQERRRAEAEDLAADLGDDWYVLDEPPAASVHPTEALVATLPEGMSTGVLRDILRDAELSELCAARTEDGMRREACEPVPGTDTVASFGVMIDPGHRGEGTFDSRFADVIVYHERDDGSIVKVRVIVAGAGWDAAADPSALRPWLEAQIPDLTRAATSGF